MKTAFKPFLLLIFWVSVICGVSVCQANAAEQTHSNEIKAENQTSAAPNKAEIQTISNTSVTGTYDRNTKRDGEGYDNSLVVERAGTGKLRVSIRAAYLYQTSQGQVVHEANADGEAHLKGSTAVARLTDEDKKPCRATVIFAADKATLHVPPSCAYSVRLEGVYKKSSDEAVFTALVPPMPIIGGARLQTSWIELEDFIREQKPGNVYVVNDVPASKINILKPTGAFGNGAFKGMFQLETGEPEDKFRNNIFVTSPAMIKSLKENKTQAATLRATAVQIVSNSSFDFLVMSFITKIEGLDENGKVLWTATGSQAPKLKFEH